MEVMADFSGQEINERIQVMVDAIPMPVAFYENSTLGRGCKGMM